MEGLPYNSGRLIAPLTPLACFRILVRRGKVPADVDLNAPDGGYESWYEGHWVPRVKAMAVEKSRTRAAAGGGM